jgi:hypothetical protein
MLSRKILIPGITAAALMGGTGIAYANVTPTPTPTDTITIAPVIPTPTFTPPPRRFRRCVVEFIRMPVVNPLTGERVRFEVIARVCANRNGNVTVNLLGNPFQI